MSLVWTMLSLTVSARAAAGEQDARGEDRGKGGGLKSRHHRISRLGPFGNRPYAEIFASR